MSLDRVRASVRLPSLNKSAGSYAAASGGILAAAHAQTQRPAIASTRAWIFDTEKLLQNVRYAEESSKQMRSVSSRVLSKDHKDTAERATRVDREVRSSVEQTAQTSCNLEKALAAHEAELVKLLMERNAARDALALVYAPLEKVRKRIELRLANPLPMEERTDTSVLEALQCASKSLSECSRMLVAFIKDAERHCTHMESLRKAMRLEIKDKHESMKVTYAGSHEVDNLPPIMHSPRTMRAGVMDDVGRGDYAQMLKSDMLRCLRLSQNAISESVMIRSRLSQCVKDIAIVRTRNEKLLDTTLDAHVRDTEMLVRTLGERRAAVKQEIEKLKDSEAAARREKEVLVAPARMAAQKTRDRVRYSRVLRDGRGQDAVTLATADEAAALAAAVNDAGRCETTLTKHRERLEAFYEQLANAEKSKSKVMQLAVATVAGHPVVKGQHATPRKRNIA